MKKEGIDSYFYSYALHIAFGRVTRGFRFGSRKSNTFLLMYYTVALFVKKKKKCYLLLFTVGELPVSVARIYVYVLTI